MNILRWENWLNCVASVVSAFGIMLLQAPALADGVSVLGVRSLSSVISEPAVRPAVGPACTQNVSITSLANQHLVSAELGYAGSDYAMLRARATAVGPWEQYTLCNYAGDGYWTIQSQANGLYVSAELGYSGNQYGMLRARASVVGPWEKFVFRSCGLGCTTILSQANGLFVSAELGYPADQYGMLRARASVVGPWEQFR
ncbi:hypothetical protein BLA23254_08057 [Burkholderia lata]|uniref:Uncharacterized protein n=1 Tax=Burkholderia lata (strain ATCC 17760 / DSM 23089 / LMG 22485 / NCIMB 9086 / R18194 / 383) TaxID=482957 RepID=A0A6P2ST82_BURL3|nr:hypothetical protein [Burkholderia lata]VWC52709.1 hypothetical protein BLA23254_08057 [Burkholderia lata]